MIVTTNTTVSAVEFDGCGHVNYISDQLIEWRRNDHRNFYCTTCGNSNIYPQKSREEKLRGVLTATQDMLATARAQRDENERRRRAEKAAKTRIKNRISKGVCPCCNRTFENLAAHMTTQHPNYAEETSP